MSLAISVILSLPGSEWLETLIRDAAVNREEIVQFVAVAATAEDFLRVTDRASEMLLPMGGGYWENLYFVERPPAINKFPQSRL